MTNQIGLLTIKDVLNRWQIDLEKLKLLISFHGLPAYRIYSGEKIANRDDLRYLRRIKSGGIFFKLEEVEQYEIQYPELQNASEEKLLYRGSQRHKERCRALAQYFWEQAQTQGVTLTANDMIKKYEIIEIGCEGVKYGKDTLRDWIKDLNPDRRPGRRSKKS